MHHCGHVAEGVKMLGIATRAPPPGGVGGMHTVLWPLAVYFGIVLLLAVMLLAASALLGERHHERAKGLPYESGVASTGSARLRFGVSFYLVAVFFVIFDIEAAFLFAWAIALRDIGWAGYLEGLIFIGVLMAALGYLWRSGGLAFASGFRSVR